VPVAVPRENAAAPAEAVALLAERLPAAAPLVAELLEREEAAEGVRAAGGKP
jgi:hypothetical protein